MNTPVSFELAKLLKEKCFDKRTPMVWLFSLGKPHLRELHLSLELNDCEYNAPTIADVVMWLLEEHKLLVYVDLPWHFRIRYLDSDSRFFDIDREDGIELIPTGLLFSHTKIFKFTSIHEAYEAGINYCLTNLI